MTRAINALFSGLVGRPAILTSDSANDIEKMGVDKIDDAMCTHCTVLIWSEIHELNSIFFVSLMIHVSKQKIIRD